ncbi:glycosyltransferase [Acinetobacter pittii]|uniref:glycosyltransferase n=1 Tax=Acinetobacter pittii TaxID=48296 RepID=UPI00320BAED8
MNIVFQYYKGSGGALINIKHMLEAIILQNPNWNFVIVCSKTSVLSEIETPYNNLTYEYIVESNLPGEISRLLFFTLKLKKIVEKYSADIIWSMNVGPYVNTSACHVLSLNNAFQVCDSKLLEIHPSGSFRVNLLRFFFRISMRYTNLTILQTPFMEKLVKKNFHNTKTVVAKKSVGISNNLSNDKNPICEKINPHDFNVIYVATDYPYKRHLLLLKALNLFNNEIPNLKLIVTLTYEQCLNIDFDLTTELHRKGILICLGWVQPKDLESLYKSSKIAVMPSLIESLSSSHIEAMFWGIPQITSNLAYAKDLCKEAAYYVNDHESPQAWKDAIITLYNDPSLYQQLIQQGYQEAKMLPQSWNDAANTISKEFSKIMGEDKYV